MGPGDQGYTGRQPPARRPGRGPRWPRLYSNTRSTAWRRSRRRSARRRPAMFFSDYRGLTVGQITELRGQLRQNDARYAVVKNRYTKIALRELGPRRRRSSFWSDRRPWRWCVATPLPCPRRCSTSGAVRRYEVKGGYVDGKMIDMPRRWSPCRGCRAATSFWRCCCRQCMVRYAAWLPCCTRRWRAWHGCCRRWRIRRLSRRPPNREQPNREDTRTKSPIKSTLAEGEMNRWLYSQTSRS